MFFAFVLAGINLIWNFPVFINILIDIYLSYRILWFYVTTFLVIYPWPKEVYWCPDQAHNKPVCNTKLIALQILLGIVIGLVSAIG